MAKRKNPVIRGAESALRASKDHLQASTRTLRIAFNSIHDEGASASVLNNLRTAQAHVTSAYSLVKQIHKV
jgi:hypothetical protein